jgi:hypothetical protein
VNAHGICEQGRHEPCNTCGAQCEQPCHGTPDHPREEPGAVHLCRICLAAHHQRITKRDAVSMITETVTEDEDGLFAGWSLILDPETAA